MKLGLLAILTIALFVGTVAVGAVGLTYYYGYRRTLLALARPLDPGNVLPRFSSLKYKVYVSPEGYTYYVDVSSFPSNNTVVIAFYNLSNDLVARVVAQYNTTNITYVVYEGPHFSEVFKGANLSGLLPQMMTSMVNVTNPTTGTIALYAFPGLGPIYALSYFTSYYDISWSSLATGSGQPSPEATVLYSFAPVQLDGKTYRGIVLSISPQSSFLGISGAYSVNAEVVQIDGIPVAAQLIIGTGGANYISITLESYSLAGAVAS